MTDKATVTTEVDVLVGGNYRAWRIGLTNDVRETRKQLTSRGNDLSGWQQWKADSLADAKSLEQAYVASGMKGVTSGIVSEVFPTFVFIF